jgi:arabinofuranosyltransferase
MIAREQVTTRTRGQSWSRMDWILIALLLLLCCFWIHRLMHWDFVPVEDAAILLRYARNLANGYGIRWNVGQHPIDGATDFLYMAAIAGISRITGLGVIQASRLLNLTAYIGSVLLVYVGSRRLFDANRWVSVGLAAYLIACPGVQLARGCFGAPFFGAALLSAWFMANLYVERRRSWDIAIAFALLSLISGLVRPEGVIVTAAMLVAILYGTGKKDRSKVVVSYLVVFAVLGGGYFIWHWRYFGYPLPNPYYVKGRGHLHWDGLLFSCKEIGEMLAPVIPLIPFGWSSPRCRNRTVRMLLVAVPYALMWVLLETANDFAGRFQYPVLALVLLMLPGIWEDMPAVFHLKDWRSYSLTSRRTIALCSVLGVLVSMGYIDGRFHSVDSAFGMRPFARKLEPYADRGYTMAITEAGTLPFYSRWNAIDLFALNDAVIAHSENGRLPRGYLDQVRPALVMYHAWGSVPESIYDQILTGGPPDPGMQTGRLSFIQAQVATLQLVSQYVHSHDYILAAAYGSDPCNLHLYWVRADLPDADDLVRVIRETPYYFLDNGKLAADFRNNLLPSGDCRLNR